MAKPSDMGHFADLLMTMLHTNFEGSLHSIHMMGFENAAAELTRQALNGTYNFIVRAIEWQEKHSAPWQLGQEMQERLVLPQDCVLSPELG